MKTNNASKLTEPLGELRAGLLAAIAEMDKRGTDAKVTQAMCIIEESFNFVARGQRIVPSKAFHAGMTRASVAGFTAD